MADEPQHPMAAAMQWVGRVFAASLMMSLPGLGGQWLDGRWQTQVFGPAGFVLGLVGGVTYLITVTRQAERVRQRSRRAKSGAQHSDGRRRDGQRGPMQGGDSTLPPEN